MSCHELFDLLEQYSRYYSRLLYDPVRRTAQTYEGRTHCCNNGSGSRLKTATMALGAATCQPRQLKAARVALGAAAAAPVAAATMRIGMRKRKSLRKTTTM